MGNSSGSCSYGRHLRTCKQNRRQGVGSNGYGNCFGLINRLIKLFVGLFIVLLVPNLYLIRYLAKTFIKKCHLFYEPVILVGAGKTAERVLRYYRNDLGYRYDIVGLIDDNPLSEKVASRFLLYGKVADAESIIRDSGVQTVIITAPGMHRDQLQELISKIQPYVRDISFAPDLIGTPMIGAEAEVLFSEEVLMLHMRNNLARRRNRIIKRVFDIICTTIGSILTLDTLFQDGYDAVFIGSGVWRPRGLGVRGESLGNCHYAVDYLQNPDVYHLGDRVAVIGSGNSAMDAARTAIRKGSRFVTVYARRNEVRASIREYEYAQADGVEFDLCKGVAAITKDGPMLYERHFDKEGNLLSEDEPQLYPADSTIIAVSQAPKDKIVRTTTGLEVDNRGLVEVDENGATTREGVFSGGDVVLGPANVVEVVKDAKHVAKAMDAYLMRKRENGEKNAYPRETAE